MEQPTLVKEKNRQLNNRINELEGEKAELHQLLDKALALNKLKSDFRARASHDLRSPLTNIQLSASLIEHYYHRMNQDKVFVHLARIKDEVSRFVVLLNNYLLTPEGEKPDEDQFIG